MKILVSSCLLGRNVRYDGKNNYIEHEIFEKNQIFPICPEVDGGLPTPRAPSEIIGDKVINIDGEDVSDFFQKGANYALLIAKKHNIKVAILKSKSPSCSNNMVYDGTFSKRLVPKMGVTAKLLEKNGIKVFNENELEEALIYLREHT
ncbi:MAG: DUF523 domain-containing protein [Sulfurospirillum sp.]|nr:MAG: DUF523 domain-containing protein [Sulfurospirillum sp.]